MSRFTFRLQKVLELKEKSEQVAALELARAQGRADEARTALEALAAVHTAGAASLAAAQGESPTVGQLRNFSFVLEQIDQQVTQAADAATTAESGVANAQADLTAAFQARRVLDRLRDKKKDEWQTAETQSDLQQMDDLALTRFSKQNPQLSDDT